MSGCSHPDIIVGDGAGSVPSLAMPDPPSARPQSLRPILVALRPGFSSAARPWSNASSGPGRVRCQEKASQLERSKELW